jgi:hypothetical protein
MNTAANCDYFTNEVIGRMLIVQAREVYSPVLNPKKFLAPPVKHQEVHQEYKQPRVHQ